MAPPGRGDFASKLRDLRLSERLSREGLARASGVSPSALANLEHASDPRTGKAPRPRIETLQQLANGLAREALYGGVDAHKADRYYRELMLAAGYVVADERRPEGRDAIREQAMAWLEQEAPDITVTIAETGRDWTEDDVTYLRATINAIREMQRRRRRENPAAHR